MLGITALVPAEVIYACRENAVDLNNFVPFSEFQPDDKLCAWSAIWRELILRKEVEIDKLVVVAGGDCYNALVDGEKIELSGIPTLYFIYSFNRDIRLMEENLDSLVEFAGGIKNEKAFGEIADLKQRAMEIDSLRTEGKLSSIKAFEIEISGSDLMGSPDKYGKAIEALEEEDVDFDYRVAILGIPPIYKGFHEFLQSTGLHVAYDEMPFEFIRHSGRNLGEVAESYVNYTFAGNIWRRMEFVEKQLKERNIDAIIHFQQFSCHHKLEDIILRERFADREGYPYITIEADLPGSTPEQARLRLEAFAERLAGV